MTLGITPPLIDYIENGVTLIHAVPFEFQGLEEIVCQRNNGSVVTPCVAGADFTVAGGGGLAGSVTKMSAGVAGTVFRIKRVTTRGQPTDFVSHDNFPAEDVDIALDRLAAVNQEQEIEVTDLEGRAVRVPVGEAIAALPPPNDRKGTLFGFSLPTGIRELLTYANVSTLLAPFLAPLLSAINKGDPGGNIMAIGLFLAGSTLNIPGGTDLVRTSGYSATGKGGAAYQYDAAVDAAYVAAHPRTAFISANARGFRLSLDQQLKVTMFGAVGNDTANDGAAFVSAIAFSNANAQDGTGFGKAGPSMAVPFGKYYLGAQTLDYTYTIDFFGDGGGYAAGSASQLRWDDGTTGLRTQAADTTGATGQGPQAYPGAAGSTFSNLFLKGGYVLAESEAHAFHMRGKAFLNNVYISNWGGDGVAIIAGLDAFGGNCNSFGLNRVQAQLCRNGVHCRGADTNRGKGWVDVSNNRWCGILDQSFLGNTWEGLCENSGKIPGVPPTMVSHGGNWFAAVWGQQAGAATNAPPLTQTDNTWWYYVTPGAAFPTLNVPDWFNGIVVRPGGPIVTDNPNATTLILNFGTELYQAPMQLVEPTLVLTGWNGAGIKGTAGRISQSDTATLIQSLRVTDSCTIGPTNGSPAGINATTIFGSTDDRHLLEFLTWLAGVPTINAQVLGKLGGGLLLSGNPAISFYVGDPSAPIVAGEINANGMDIPNDTAGVSGYYVGGLKVAGARGSAIGDPGGGAVIDVEARAVIVSILNAMRAGGSIA